MKLTLAEDVEGLGAAAIIAKYLMALFVFSVFPAPDSPLWGARQT